MGGINAIRPMIINNRPKYLKNEDWGYPILLSRYAFPTRTPTKIEEARDGRNSCLYRWSEKGAIFKISTPNTRRNDGETRCWGE
jgi:hypothetical protein